MSKGVICLSGAQIFKLQEEVLQYAEKNQLTPGDIVVNINLQSGYEVLVNSLWDWREMTGAHTEETPVPYIVPGFSASIRY